MKQYFQFIWISIILGIFFSVLIASTGEGVQSADRTETYLYDGNQQAVETVQKALEMAKGAVTAVGVAAKAVKVASETVRDVGIDEERIFTKKYYTQEDISLTRAKKAIELTRKATVVLKETAMAIDEVRQSKIIEMGWVRKDFQEILETLIHESRQFRENSLIRILEDELKEINLKNPELFQEMRSMLRDRMEMQILFGDVQVNEHYEHEMKRIIYMELYQAVLCVDEQIVKLNNILRGRKGRYKGSIKNEWKNKFRTIERYEEYEERAVEQKEERNDKSTERQ